MTQDERWNAKWQEVMTFIRDRGDRSVSRVTI